MLKVSQAIYHAQFGKGVVTRASRDETLLYVLFEADEFEKVIPAKSKLVLEVDGNEVQRPGYLETAYPKGQAAIVAEKSTEEYAELAAYVRNGARPRLRFAYRDDVGRQRALDEFTAWTGEFFPADLIPAKPVSAAHSDREWFLTFDFDPSISYPERVLEMGLKGRGRDRREACFLHRRGRITVCFAFIVEKLIRAGVRP